MHRSPPNDVCWQFHRNPARWLPRSAVHSAGRSCDGRVGLRWCFEAARLPGLPPFVTCGRGWLVAGGGRRGKDVASTRIG